jgi:hypothetical protein
VPEIRALATAMSMRTPISRSFLPNKTASREASNLAAGGKNSE